MQAYNPFLPSWEYIPDPEPYVFGDRVYIFGSHDRFRAPIFCVNDYVCWSAPLSDLGHWSCSGTLYTKQQDLLNRAGLHLLFAPDVVRGADGRFYLYYALDFMGVMGVAVCDTPDGQYQFLGHVRHRDGTCWGSRRGDEFPFDPGVLLDDDGRVYLYSGFATKIPFFLSRFHNLRNSGGMVLELEEDMLTIKQEPKLLFPRRGNHPPRAFEGHEFFEASSIRKIDGRYVFVYSSVHNHELCWAVSDSPTGDFRFGGTLVDQGDLYLDGRTDEGRALNYLGNTHGGMVQLQGDWYIFYHRQTHQHSYSRQACAEKLTRTPDGGFRQAEVTSCGLNGGPLKGEGTYPAYIACNLWGRDGTARYDRRFRKAAHPYFTQDSRGDDPGAVQYIANMREGAVAGFKYFDLQRAGCIRAQVGGHCKGRLEVSAHPDFARLAAALPVQTTASTGWFSGALDLADGVQPLYFRYAGEGAMDFYAFEISVKEQK